MDPIVNSKIEEIKTVVLENNLLLKKLVKQGRIALWSKFVYWAILILITVGAFTIIKPLLGSLGSVYAPDGLEASLKSFGTQGGIEELKAQLSE